MIKILKENFPKNLYLKLKKFILTFFLRQRKMIVEVLLRFRVNIKNCDS